jgi:ArsR family transcriptional regulator
MAAARQLKRASELGIDAVRLAQLAKALAHPARVQIVVTLLERRSCIGCDLAEQTSLAASTTSEHLRILKSAGIITGEIARPRVCYSLNPTAFDELKAFLDAMTGPGPVAVQPRKAR